MKRTNKFSVLLFAALVVLGVSVASCDKNEDEKASLKFSKLKSTVVVSKIDTIKISGGISPYTAISGDVKIATATVKVDTLFVTGVKKGITSIAVKDKNQVSGTLNVTVNNPALVFDKNAVEVAVNATMEVTVSTGVSPYTAVSNDKSIATVTVSENKISIKGVKVGTTTVTVADKDKNSVGTLAVKVK